MRSVLSYRGYRVFVTQNFSTSSIQSLVDNILDINFKPQHIFKDNSRTYAALLLFEGQLVMLKIPRARNSRRWERVLTLFRKGEAVRTLHNLELMQQLQLNAPIPLMAAEKRHSGMVVDGFACYVYEQGRPAGPNDARNVVSALLHLHELGYLRTDPQAANFLVADRGIVFIDFRLKKPLLLSSFKKNFELAKLVRVFPECNPFVPYAISDSISFKLAQALELELYKLRQRKRELQVIFRRKGQ